MSRILEISASPEEAVVSRVLLLVHQVIDDRFPNLQNSNRQFTKTVFSDEGENTAQQFLPTEALNDEDHLSIPPPPVDGRGLRKPPVPAPVTKPSSRSTSGTPKTDASTVDLKMESSGGLSNSTRLGTDIEALKPDSPLSDWSTRITVALLFAGIILLIYAILA
jgi:hypothetical protein